MNNLSNTCLFCSQNLTTIKNHSSKRTTEHIFGKSICHSLGVINQNVKKPKTFDLSKYPLLNIYAVRELVGQYQNKDVCQSCNNGWMNNQIEKPIQKIINEKKSLKLPFFEFKKNEQEDIARWFIKIGLLLIASDPSNPYYSNNQNIWNSFKKTVENNNSIEKFLLSNNCILLVNKNSCDESINESNTSNILMTNVSFFKNLNVHFFRSERIVVKFANQTFCLCLPNGPSKIERVFMTEIHNSYPKEFIKKNFKEIKIPFPLKEKKLKNWKSFFKIQETNDNTGYDYCINFGGTICIDYGLNRNFNKFCLEMLTSEEKNPITKLKINIKFAWLNIKEKYLFNFLK